MTDYQTLQKLFQAALDDTSDKATPLRKAAPPVRELPAALDLPLSRQDPPASVPREPAPVAEATAPSPANAGLCDAESSELAALLDARHRREARKNRREKLVTLVVLLALAVGGLGWFLKSPQRVTVSQEALKDIRSVGDAGEVAGKYREALDRVAARSRQLDESAGSLGANSD